MSLWQRLTAGGTARRAVGVSLGADGPRRVGVDGSALVADAPAGFAPGHAVGVVPDAGTLLRRLALPPAKAAVTDRLVRQQVASLLPGMDGRLAIAWRRDATSGEVTVAAAPRAALRAAAQAAADVRGCDLQVPAGLALDALLSRGMSAADAPAAWAIDTDGLTWLLLYAGGGLIAADSVGPGEAAEAVFADLVAGMEPEARPSELTWVGRGGALPEASDGVAHVRAADLPPQTGWTSGGAEPAAWLAAGAALIGRQLREAEGLDLEETPGPAEAEADAAQGAAPAPRRRRPGRAADTPAVSGMRWAVVGLWLLGALGLWAWAVGTGGARQAAVIDELGLSSSAIPTLDRGLAVGRYLETSGPSALAVLDELGQKTKRWMLDEVTWERDGGLTLRGTMQSADALAKLAQSMATMRTLTGVQVRRQTPEGNNKVAYTITASPSAKFFGAFVEPRKPATDKNSDADGAETAAPQAPPEPKKKPKKKPAAAVDREPTPADTPTPAAPQAEPADIEAKPKASGPITSIDDPRVQALLEKYPALRERAEQMAGQGVNISEADFERLEQALESQGGIP